MPLEALRYEITPAGLHYLLIHYDIPAVDPETWRLEVVGGTDGPMELSLAELMRRTAVTRSVTLECAGNGRALIEPRVTSQPWLLEAVGNASWTGTPLAPLLRGAGIPDGTVEVVFTALDRGIEKEIEQDYERSLSLGEAMRDEVLLVWAMNGAPLPPQHGFPLRLIVPGWYGMTHVKWLRRIAFLSSPFTGFQNSSGYRMRQAEDEPGEPVDRIAVRSLMIPPGIPEFLSRSRIVDAGDVELRGRAWSGSGAIERVEVSLDAGQTWADASLDALPEPYAWRGWSFRWRAVPGELELCSRATDGTGAIQPLEPEWNVGGYMNNAVQRIAVLVR